MPGQEEAQAKELDLLQDYVKFIMDILEVILKESPLNYEYLIELSQESPYNYKSRTLITYFMLGKEN